MAAIDDLLISHLVSEIASELDPGSSAGRKIVVPFEAFELAGQMDFALESEVTTLMSQLATAKGWTIKVYFFERKVEISD